MAKAIPLPHNIVLVLNKSRKWTKAVIALAVVLSMATIGLIHTQAKAAEERVDDLKAQAALLEQENGKLSDQIDDLGSVAGVEEIAREELGLADPDTVIFQPEG